MGLFPSFLFSVFDSLLIVYRNAKEFYMLILYSITTGFIDEL